MYIHRWERTEEMGGRRKTRESEGRRMHYYCYYMVTSQERPRDRERARGHMKANFAVVVVIASARLSSSQTTTFSFVTPCGCRCHHQSFSRPLRGNPLMVVRASKLAHCLPFYLLQFRRHASGIMRPARLARRFRIGPY